MRINKIEARNSGLPITLPAIFLNRPDLPYDPNRLFDCLITIKKMRSDAALSRFLKVTPPVISKIRSGHVNISPNLLLKIHDAYNIPINELRAVLGSAANI